MSRHSGVSCDNCLESNFRGKRFKCLVCYDYDLCENCHGNSISTSRHLKDHPMQCILTRNEFELFYAGESVAVDTPPAFTCPLCGALGFSDTTLQEHVNLSHQDNNTEVVCPICAALPSGDPNHVTDDFATHLGIEHHNAQRESEEPNGRPTRRMFYPGRGIRGGGTRSRAINMHFGDGPTSPSAGTNANSNLSMDPIAELLSQLSGVRHSHLQSMSTATQLQELHTQLQFERQKASILRQQLERVPSKNQSSQNAAASGSRSFAEAAKLSAQQKSPASAKQEENDEDARFLLPRLNADNSTEQERATQNTRQAEISFFVRDLLMSLEDLQNDENSEPQPDTSTKAKISENTSCVATTVPLASSNGKKFEEGNAESEKNSNECVRPRFKQAEERENDSNDIRDDGVKRKVNILTQQQRDNAFESSRNTSHESADPRQAHLRFSGQILLTSDFLSQK